MTKKLILVMLFHTFLSQNILGQENPIEKYNLMPWPKEIKDNSAKFLIDSNPSFLEISY